MIVQCIRQTDNHTVSFVVIKQKQNRFPLFLIHIFISISQLFFRQIGTLGMKEHNRAANGA